MPPVLAAALVLVHGVVTQRDAPSHLLRIAHEPLPAMAMKMEMPTYQPDARDLDVRVGERVALRCDLTLCPWVCRDVHAAPLPASARPPATQWSAAAVLGMPFR